MKRTVDFLGNILGTACALLVVAVFFYHTTNDYFSVFGKFRDFSILGWAVMLLLWSRALYDGRKGRYSLLQFMTWMTIVCFVLEFYRFLIYSGNENCKVYLKVVMGLEIAALLIAVYRRYKQMIVYAITAFLITYFASFVLFPSSLYLTERMFYILLGVGALLWLLIKLCYMYQWSKGVFGIKCLSWLVIFGILLSIALMWYQHMVFGIRFYEKPIKEAVKNPKVSIVVPVYNEENNIERALDSLRKQTLKDIEIIVVDDGSTDKTPEILDKYAAFDKRIKVIHQKNAYIGAARNRGMAEAKGEYIGFIDADDWVELNFYEELYKEAVKQQVDFIFTKNVWTVTQRFPEVKEKLSPIHKTIPAITDIGFGFVWNKLYRREFLSRHHILFTERRTLYEDQYFLIQLIRYAHKIGRVDNVRYYYTRYKTSITNLKKHKADYVLFDMYADLDAVIKNSDIDGSKLKKTLKSASDFRKFAFSNLYTLLNCKDRQLWKQLVKEKYPDDNIDFDKIDEEIAEMVKVSVIVPVYNEEKTVKRTLDSLINQILQDMEIIVVDDGSTDNTPQILDEYADKYSYIEVIHQENAYVGAARNAGRKLARGKYIAFIDADDTVSANFYEKLYQTAEKYKADIVAAEKVIFVWENKNDFKELYKERAAFMNNEVIKDLASYRQKVDGYVWDKLYRRAFLDEHNIWCTLRRTPAEDNFLTTPALMFADKMYVAKGTKFYYHRGNPSETGVKHTKLSDEIVEMFADLAEFIKASGLEQDKIATWLKATAVARQRIIGDYYQCLAGEDKAVAKEKIFKAFPDDAAIFEDSAHSGEQHHQLYQQVTF